MGIFAQMFLKILYRHIAMPCMAAYVICILTGPYVACRGLEDYRKWQLEAPENVHWVEVGTGLG